MGFIEKIFEQTFSRHPYLFLFMILVAGGSLSHSYSVFAQKSSVEDELSEYKEVMTTKLEAYQASNVGKFEGIEVKISTMEHRVLVMFSRQAVMNYSSEIHTLSELDRAGKANNRDRRRLRELQIALAAEIRSQERGHAAHKDNL